MTGRRGTNQHQYKFPFLRGKNQYGAEFWRDIFFIAFIVVAGILIILFTSPKIISPCPDSGCAFQTVKAGDPANLTSREITLIEGLRVFGLDELKPLENLINKESRYNPWAVNPSSGACGIGQALPCKKMKCDLGDSVCQAKWVVSYIKARYGMPSIAWEFHKKHGWY